MEKIMTRTNIKPGQRNIRISLNQYLLELLLLVLIAVMAFASPYFLTPGNFLNILRNISMQGILAFGMTMVIICGEIDLSVSSTVAMSGVMIGLCWGKWGSSGVMPGWFVFLIGILSACAVGTVTGLVNTYFVTKFKMPSMIVTLAMMNVLYGICAMISNGFPVVTFPGWYSTIGAGFTMEVIPNAAIFMLIVFLLIYIIMHKTKLGRDVYASGGNAEAARLSGINVVRTKAVCMVLVQITAVISGIILSSQVMAGNFTFAKDWGMTVISSVIIGGASFNGGIGTMKGTLVGLVFLGVVSNAMTLLNVGEYAQYVVRGSLMIFAVVMNTLQSRKQA